MSGKWIMVLAIIVAVIFSVSAVSANENLTDSDEIVGVDDNIKTFDDLKTEIDNTENGGTLNLTQDYVYESGSTEGIIINKNITINGNNHKIDGIEKSRIFKVEAAHITINDLSLLNGYSNQGGAIYCDCPIVLNNITFVNNRADEGGAILYSVDMSEILNSTIINNCIFDGNQAKFGAAMYVTPIVKWDSDNGSEIIDDSEDYNPDDAEDYYPDDDNGVAGYRGDDDDDSDDDDDDGGDDPEMQDELVIVNSIFKNSYNTSRGIISCDASIKVNVSGSTFANSSSDYGTAVMGISSVVLKCINNTFVNLHAISGGAITLMMAEGFIENCTFINTTSSSNGGAICINSNGGDQYSLNNNITIRNSRFINAQSKYGGSIAYFGCSLLIYDSIFENSTAVASGGAIYVVNCELTTSNVTFKNSRLISAKRYEGNGGAINAYGGIIRINNTYFINNSNNAIYADHNEYIITNCFFNNNTEAIRSVFLKYSKLENNNYTNDALAEDADVSDYYIFIINETGIPISLIENEIIVDNLPTYFNSRDWGWVSPVKDQTGSGACWIFSTCAGLESALLKNTGVEYDLSINNIHKNLMIGRYALNDSADGGYPRVATGYILSWYGAISAQEDPFDAYGIVTVPIISDNAIHVQDVIWFDPNENLTKIDEIKRNIMKYGAIVTTMTFHFTGPEINLNTSSWYTPNYSTGNHAICLVGWDDNYSASKFSITPPGDGAWIIKNSYGPDNYDGGYNYVSYYDQAFFQYYENLAFIFENTETYNKNYQTDISGLITLDNTSDMYKNMYQAIEDDLISAVGTYFNCENESYVLEILVNGESKLTQSGLAPFKGFHTVKLTSNVPIKKGDNFTVIMEKSSVPLISETLTPTAIGVSFIKDGDDWVDLALNETTASLKVYTKALVNLTTQIQAANVNTVYNGGKYLTVNVRDVYGDVLEGVNVTIKLSNGVCKTLTTNSKGQVKFLTDNLAPKTYDAVITTHAFENYLATTQTAKVIVKKATVKMTAKAKTFKKSVKIKKYSVTLKTNRNKVMKNTKVTIKVNKKTYSAKTNKKGIASFKLTKLSKKGKYTATVTYSGSTYYNKLTKKVKITVK